MPVIQTAITRTTISKRRRDESGGAACRMTRCCPGIIWESLTVLVIFAFCACQATSETRLNFRRHR